MGDNKLYLLLLLSIVVFSDAQDEEAQCLLAKRYRSFHKYEYLYESESLNGLNGALNGPKASCKVEIEVPGTCHYVVHTKECTLSEVIDTDTDGSPVFRPAAASDNFKAEMEKNPLKVIVEGDNDIKLFPEDDELINILNIKRGIISALAVPVLEEERNNRMPTIFGLCKTEYTVNARGDIATDVTLTRDLSRCDNFRPIKDHTSPLALITGMNYGLAQLFNSKQTCNYKFDNTLKHMTSGVCTENHLLVPFSHQEKYGITNVAKQTVSLVGVTEYNDRVFDHNEANMKPLYLDASIDMSPIQDEKAILTVMTELADLSKTNNGRRRAHLAQKLVSMMRKANADTLSAFLPEALTVSRFLTYQALFQCGTPECSSAIMKFLRISGSSTAEIDTAVYAMGLVPNPSRALVKEMLEMARYKPTKLIYYATSNAVRRLYTAEGKVTPEIQAAADYVSEEIGDCTGDQEHIYLTLRVTGNMAAAVGAASPALKSAVIQCISQPAATPKVQQAAIQVFRLTPIPEEGRSVLLQVVLDGVAPLQKRIAAYLILMKDPQADELTQITAALPNEQNLQAKSFFISHMTNILSSTAPETRQLRERILDALQGNEIGEVMNPAQFSRNYKIGSLQGSMIFGEDELPKEIVLEMTLNAFGFDFDMFEVGVEGKGFEPTVEALFGPNGFFPDTVMKTIYFAADKMPPQFNQVLRNIIPELRNDRKKRQATQNIVREITQNVEKLINDLKAQDTPEAMLYLRLLGAELGYLKMEDMQELAHAVSKVVEKLLKMFPAEYIKGLFSSTDNELFLHYMFMDNEFYLPTGPGVPLRVALSGTFAPGFKGGLKIARDMSEISCMPSVGVEFVTEIGTHLPDYVQSGLEMHTSLYHERGITAKLALAQNQIKLTIPAPETPSKLISITNSLFSVAGDDIKTVPAMMNRINKEECNPIFPGLNLCGAVQFSYGTSNDASPYFPLSGDSSYEVELRPTGEVSEYTATITYAHEQMVDKVTIDVKAEGTPTEATAQMMFNRKTYTASAELQIPEYIDVGFRIDTADQPSTARGARGVKIDFLNNNVAQGSLVGLAKIDALKEAMLQVQLLVPSLQTDAKMTANLKRAEDLVLELESDIKFFKASSVQNLVLKYDDERIKAEIKSDVSCETESILSEFDAILDQRIGKTDMTVRHVLTSSVQATNNYLEASKIPFVEELRVPAFPKIDVPKTLFMNIGAGAEYRFANQYYTFDFFLPLGGKSSMDLNFPSALTTPQLALPMLGLELAPISVPIPEIVVPERMTLHMPKLGMATVSGKLSSNLYNMEANASAGRDLVEHLSYSAKLDATGTGPVDILDFRVQGLALLSGSSDSDVLTAKVNTAVTNKLIDVRVNIQEELTLKEMTVKSSSNFEANTALGVKASLEHTGQLAMAPGEISGDSNLKGSVTGLVQGDVTLEQSLALFPFRPEGRIQSSLKVDSTALQAENRITATFANGELSVQLNTEVLGERLTHTAEVTFMQSRFAVKSDAKALALGMKIQNIAEASVGARDMNIKFETTTDSGNHVKSLITAILNENGLAVNGTASAKVAGHTASHRSKLTLNKNGLVTSCNTNLKSPLILSNTFRCSLDRTKASLSVKTNAKFVNLDLTNDISMTASTSSLALTCKSQGSFAKDLGYVNDISVQAEPYSAVVNINNDLKILPIQINNGAVLKAEPYKADLTGSVKVALNAEELKHTYEIKYADLTATAKCSTTGKLMGSHMSHDSEIEIAGLSVRINNNANFNSQPVRLSTTLQATAVPFSFNLNALANGDGELNLYGKQNAQVYTKILLKAEPLALAHSHECRISTKHEFSNDVTVEMNLDNKVDTVLTPSEQTATIRMKSKVNNNEISQDVSAYNNDKRIGLEVSGVFTNIDISDQDFSLSGFLKYDKNSESHVISLPFIESLPAVAEYIKNTAVTIIEALQNYIKTEDFVDKIQTLLQYVRDVVTDLNLEEKVVQLKNDLIMFAQDCPITVESLEASVVKLSTAAQMMQSEVEKLVKEMVKNGAPTVQKLTEKLNALMEEYKISSLLVAVIEAIENVIKQIDIMTLKDSSIAFLYNLNEQYAIKDTLEEMVRDLKEMVANFDMAKFVEDVKDFIISFDIKEYTEDLMDLFPTEKISKYANRLKQLITDLDITGRCKIFFSNMKDILVKYGVDKKIEEFLDRIVELIKQFKIDQTVQVLTDTLKSIQHPFPNLLDEAITYLKTTEMKDIIEDLNKYLEALVQKIRSFDYNAFVDEANQKISECTTKLNDLIVSLELPQKLEAATEFINYAVSSFSAFFEELKAVKVADVLKIIDNVVLNNIKAFSETFKQKINDINLKEQIISTLNDVSDIYTRFLDDVTATINDIIDMAQSILGDQPVFTELKQIIEGIISGLKTAELVTPSFDIPFTNLMVPSKSFKLNQLDNIELPTQFELPEFIFLGTYTVPAFTIRLDEFKQMLLELIDFITNFEIERLTNNTYFGELTLNYLPDFSAITLPEITLPDISFPAIPKLRDEYMLNIPLRIPEIKLPKIPDAVVMPAFGKLYSDIRLRSPIYTLRTSAEIQNSTDNKQMHHFTAFLTSMGSSARFPILNFNLDSTARIGIPRMSRLIIAETLKFVHSALTVEHQASVTFYGLSAQATAQTTMKAKTELYQADFVNKAFFAVEGGMSASFDTTYKHQLEVPFLSVVSEVALTQSGVALQKDGTIKLTVKTLSTDKRRQFEFSDLYTYKNDISFVMDLRSVKLTFTEEFDSDALNIKETLYFEAVALSHIDFNGTIETKSPLIKKSLAVASGRAHLGDMKVELEATHDTELVGDISGTLSSAFHLMMRPIEIVIDFQNKANAKAKLEESLSAKIDLQNDYAVILNTQKQRVSTVALVRFNQYKYTYNFTADNMNTEAGVYAAVNGETDLEFLNVPINIPEIVMPVFDFTIPPVNNLNLYEHFGLKNLLTTTKHTIDVDAKTVYQKRFPPIIDLGLVTVPAFGNLNSELSFKSSVFNLNANAGIQGDDDLVIRIAATSTSVYEPLKARLEGTSRLTSKRALKLATALSLENNHVKGSHNSTMTLNINRLQAAVSVNTFAKVNLPILTFEANHKLNADTKTQQKAASTLSMKYTFDFPIIKAVGSGNAENTMKLEGTVSFISAESKTKAMIDGTLLETGIVQGDLDNEASFYMNGQVTRSKLKTDGNINVNYADMKVQFDVDENLELEASISRVYTVLNSVSNNEINIAALNTKGKHVAKATIDLVSMDSLTADVEFDLSQPSTFGDLTAYEKTQVEISPSKQKISYTTDMASPVYSMKVTVDVEAPVFKVDFKSSAKSPAVFLGYNLDSYISTTMEDGALSATAKAFLEHNDFTVDFNNVISLSGPKHTLSMDITSPTFTDVNLRYTAQRDRVITSVSTPAAGTLGFELDGQTPSEMSTRLYSRSTSAPESDILTIRMAATGEKLQFLATYNLDAPTAMVMGLKERLSSITSTISNFGEKYGICAAVGGLKETIVNALTEAFTVVSNHAPDLSQLSVLYRNVVVQYQKAIQSLLNAAIKFLKETQIKLPGMEESTLLEICNKIKSNVFVVLQQIFTAISDNLEEFIASFSKTISTVQVTLPSGDVMTGEQILDYVKSNLRRLVTRIVNSVKQLESLDQILEKLRDTLQEVVEKAQEFVDTIRSDVIDAVALYINEYYSNFITLVKRLVEKADALLTFNQLTGFVEQCMEFILSVLSELTNVVSRILPAEADALVKVQDGRLEVELPFPFQQ
ncbi:apolipoprotein Bb, tandem duplicate 1 [Astyanax mexicanus]|uniref:apolipoprotein Bb, tandem duplicate 1 n=1 Tax=Astyanax mexicanus TaxID=7994 RepID=UPI0020CB57BB|nr:apolipoprotein Bb, tandem duplicate 1 [Astyanax mexicanus]